MQSSRKNFAKGFGILEVLISVVVLALIVGALVFMSRSALANSEIMQERMQATYVAQHGIEVARQIRDTNWIDNKNNTSWRSLKCNRANYVNDDTISVGKTNIMWGRSNTLGKPGDWYCFWSTDDTPDSRNFTLNGVVYEQNVFFEQASANIFPSDSSLAMKARAVVKWDSRINNQEESVQIEEILTNWRPDY